MARRKHHPSKQHRKARRKPIESRRSVAVTVAWMFASLAALVALVMAIVAEAILATTDAQEPFGQGALVLPNVVWFIALVVGLIALALTPLVYRFRPSPPPATITIAAVLIGAAPLVRVLLWMALSGS